MVYEGCIIGKINLGRDNRLRIPIRFPDGRKTVMSYPKFIVEHNIGRYPFKNETVDHVDYNPLNNELSNLRLVVRSKHAALDCKIALPKKFICCICGKVFTKEGKKLSPLVNSRGRRLPKFCSTSCSGIYGTRVQYGEIAKIPASWGPAQYTTKKLQRAFMEETSEVDTANSGKALQES